MDPAKTHFNLTAGEYEARRGGHLARRRGRVVRDALSRYAGRAGRVLEIGCGPGTLLAELASESPGTEFLGVDIDARMVEHARCHYVRPNLCYELCDLTREAPGRPYDFIYSLDLLHHVHDLSPFFSAVHALLQPGGGWLALEPNIHHPYVYWSIERMRRAGLDEDQFRPWVAEPLWREAGFAMRSRRYVMLFPGSLPPLPRAVEWVEAAVENAAYLGGSVVYEWAAGNPA